MAQVDEWLKLALHYFLTHDLFVAVTSFLSAAKGSFGLVVASTLEADRWVCIQP